MVAVGSTGAAVVVDNTVGAVGIVVVVAADSPYSVVVDNVVELVDHYWACYTGPWSSRNSPVQTFTSLLLIFSLLMSLPPY